MKKITSRFAILLVLIMAGFALYDNSSADAAPPSCWETAFNRWSSCDNGYSATITAYNQAPTVCPNTAASTCSNLYQYGTIAYWSCYYSESYTCQQQAETNYNNRGNSYYSCMGFEGNGGNCVEGFDDCEIAHDRADVCEALYTSSPDDADAYSACVANSGVWQCQ